MLVVTRLRLSSNATSRRTAEGSRARVSAKALNVTGSVEISRNRRPSSICFFARLTGAVAGRYSRLMSTSLFDQVRKLPLEEQLELVEALWDSIGDRNAVPRPTDAQKAELDRRLADHAANPDDVVPWDEVKDSALTRIGR